MRWEQAVLHAEALLPEPGCTPVALSLGSFHASLPAMTALTAVTDCTDNTDCTPACLEVHKGLGAPPLSTFSAGAVWIEAHELLVACCRRGQFRPQALALPHTASA